MKLGDIVKIRILGNKLGKIEYTTNKTDMFIVSCRGREYLLNEKELELVDERTSKIQKAENFLASLEDLEMSDFTRGYIKGAAEMLERLK